VRVPKRFNMARLWAYARRETVELLRDPIRLAVAVLPVWLQYVMRTISPTPHFVSFAQAVLFRGAELTLVWRPLLAMLIIGVIYFAVAMTRFRKVIFGS
jgi:hypothetical protein